MVTDDDTAFALALELGRILGKTRTQVVTEQRVLCGLAVMRRHGEQVTATTVLATLAELAAEAELAHRDETADRLRLLGLDASPGGDRFATKTARLRAMNEGRPAREAGVGHPQRSVRIWSGITRRDAANSYVEVARFILEASEEEAHQRSDPTGRWGLPADRELRYIDWAEFDRLADELAARLQAYRPPFAIVGISRGGLPLAVALSHRLGVRDVGFVRAWKHEEASGPSRRPAATVRVDQVALSFGPLDLPDAVSTVVVVDEIIDTTDTMEAVGARVRPETPGHAVVVQAALVCRSSAPPAGRGWAGREWASTEATDRWVVFPWDDTRSHET